MDTSPEADGKAVSTTGVSTPLAVSPPLTVGPWRILEPDPALIRARTEQYFKTAKVPTTTGLARAIGINASSFRKFLNAESKKYPEDVVMELYNARARIEEIYEERTALSRGGPMFVLKNLGWKDTQTLAGDADNPVDMKLNVVLVKPGDKAAEATPIEQE